MNNETMNKALETLAKIYQFVEEFETDFDNQDCEFYRSSISNKYAVMYMSIEVIPKSPCSIRMSEQCAEKLCEMLNNGEIEL